MVALTGALVGALVALTGALVGALVPVGALVGALVGAPVPLVARTLIAAATRAAAISKGVRRIAPECAAGRETGVGEG